MAGAGLTYGEKLTPRAIPSRRKRRRAKEKLEKSLSERIVLWVFFVLFLLYAFTLVIPFLYILVNSFYSVSTYNNQWEVRNQIRFDLFTFQNYGNALTDSLKVTTPSGKQVYLWGMTLNSLMWILITVTPNLLSSLGAAYVMSKYRFRGRHFLYTMAIAIQVIPIIGAGSSYYHLVVDVLQWANKPWFFWITYCGGFDFAFVLFYGYFNSLSWEYAEAAQIDGANNWQIYTRVMAPMARPIITALFITSFISNWNDYTTPLLYMEDFPTIAYGLYKYYNDMIYSTGGNTPLLFAGIVLSIIPVMVLYIIFHKTIMQNTVAGGLKG